MSKANLFVLCHGEEKLHVSELFLNIAATNALIAVRIHGQK